MRRAAVIMALIVVVSGCDSADQNPFVVSVSSVNNGGPLFADVIAFDPQTGPYIPTELAACEISNAPYQGGTPVDPGVSWYDFQVRSYAVRFTRTDGGPMTGPGWDIAAFNHVESTSHVVPFRGTSTLGLLVVPVAMKLSEPFVSLAGGGAIAVRADIDILGTPVIDPEQEIHLPLSLSVSFANFADEN